MASSSLLLLLDDIATLLDDVSLMTKVAAKKTAGVLGDDLAVNAEQVSGVKANRELPVVWAVAKGSFRNKLILVPAALLISVIAPWLITPILMLGGLFLCYEGFEKIVHSLAHNKPEAVAERADRVRALSRPEVDPVEYERDKIKGAVRTDLILSAEIIVITLGTVAAASLLNQILVVSIIAIAMTVGVYGFVAGIVKLDDAGLFLSKREAEGAWGSAQRWFGRCLLVFAPLLMKTLTVVGTVAMFMVGGGILVHGWHPLAAAVEHAVAVASGWPLVGVLFHFAGFTLIAALVGLIAGALVLGLVSLVRRWWPGGTESHSKEH